MSYYGERKSRRLYSKQKSSKSSKRNWFGKDRDFAFKVGTVLEARDNSVIGGARQSGREYAKSGGQSKPKKPLY